jgi:hypothetical protein
MSKLAIRLSTLAICTAALALAPTVTPAEAATQGHVKKHAKHWRAQHYRPRFAGEAGPIMGAPIQPGPICPQVGHSFDCKIWPPPFEDDPDRKVTKH